ncbi:SIS domain-containing protein [Klebsiella michiganensis]|uniref:SIS domain-containing protein n=1 Tax=Klebsiella michiganensis TaxID=1134687 RepID=UPI001CC98428|nr:SIS domain-containing protein [Klebsiella michiganensis]MBZ7394994.1 SIS domain-containing protein [Klebsiella michiganensis]
MSIAQKNAHHIIRDILTRQRIERVWFVGCGGSLTGFWPGKYFLDCEAKKLAVGYVTSNEFVHATPKALGENSVVILASQQGNTAETIEAARIARQKGAATIGLVYTPGTPLCEHSDYTIEYCWARYPETVDPTQQKAAYSLWLALEILAQTEGYDHYDEMVSAFANFESVVRGAQQQVQADAQHFAEAWKSEKVIYMMGSGPSFGAAHQESICILLEMQWINSASIHSGEYFHGPFEITEPGTPFMLLKSSGRTRPLDDRAIRFIERYQGKLQIIDVEKVGIAALHASVREYFCGLLHNCVLDVYNLALATARNHPLTTRRYMWKVEY